MMQEPLRGPSHDSDEEDEPRVPAECNATTTMHQMLPWTRWLRTYEPLTELPKDIVAGCTVGVLAVPQAMSYATVAGLPPVFGLYNAFVGLLPYPIFGTSPALISGPTAVMSILVGSVVPATIHGQTVHPCIDANLPHGMSEADTCPERIGLCLVLAMMAGVLQCLMGVCRLGFLVDLISEPVIVGFTSGAAFLIAATQFSNIFGIQKCTKCPGMHIHGECLFHQQLESVYLQFDVISWPTVGYGACCLVVLWVFQFPLKARLPAKLKIFANLGPLLVVVVSLIIVHAVGFNAHTKFLCLGEHCETACDAKATKAHPLPKECEHGFKVIGTICEEAEGETLAWSCLPSPAWPFDIQFCEEAANSTAEVKNHQPQIGGQCKAGEGHTESITFSDIPDLLAPAVIVALIGYMESMTIAKTVAKQRAKEPAETKGNFKLEMDPSQELFALGMCNMAVSIFSGYPVTGSFSRTAVNGNSGARSPFASAICAIVVGSALVLLTNQLKYMPKVVLAAIVVISIIKFVDVTEAIYLFRVSKRDFTVFMLIFLSTIFLGVQPALLIGILSNWALYLTNSTRAHATVLSCQPGQDPLDVKQMPAGEPVAAAAVVAKLYGDMSFAAASSLRKTVEDAKEGLPTKAIVLDCTNVNDVDRSGLHILHTISNELVEEGVRLLLANMPRHCRTTLELARRYDKELGSGKKRWDLTLLREYSDANADLRKLADQAAGGPPALVLYAAVDDAVAHAVAIAQDALLDGSMVDPTADAAFGAPVTAAAIKASLRSSSLMQVKSQAGWVGGSGGIQ